VLAVAELAHLSGTIEGIVAILVVAPVLPHLGGFGHPAAATRGKPLRAMRRSVT